MIGGGMMGRMFSDGESQSLPEPQSDEAMWFQRYCSQCHATPSPAAHTASEWPQVVGRMKQHMVSQGTAVPGRKQLQGIIAYVQRHGG